MTRLPARYHIRLGVTGHRDLRGREAELRVLLQEHLHSGMRAAWDPGNAPWEGETSPILSYTILSPLAEGADRLVAEEVLKTEGARLEVVLPMPAEDYELDFRTVVSKEKFRQLLAKAGKRHEIPGMARNPEMPAENAADSRVVAYKLAGRFVVDRCDLLIAIWDEKPPRNMAGTAAILEYARGRLPVLVLSLRDVGIGFLLNEKLRLKPVQSHQSGSTATLP